MRNKILKVTTNMLFFIIGAIIYSVSVNVFLTPNSISPGGFTGIATVANYVFGLPTGVVLIILNIPVLILGFVKLGSVFILKTALVTLLTSLSLDVSTRLLPALKTDGILASMFGGILMGLGLSLILLRGATTGGIDIIAKLVNQKYRHLSVGKIILMADGIVIVINALVYKNAESALYSIIAMYGATRMMDILLYGADKGKTIFVITSSPQEVCQEINHKVGRGVTQIPVIGGYTGEKRIMLMCSVRVHEVAAIHDAVRAHDTRAFIVVSEAGEIIGEGFKPQF